MSNGYKVLLFGQRFYRFKVDRCLKKVELMIAAGPVGTVKKPSVVGEALFKRAVGIRFLLRISSAASVSTGHLFSLRWLRTQFSAKIWRQDRLGTTISKWVDLYYPPIPGCYPVAHHSALEIASHRVPALAKLGFRRGR